MSHRCYACSQENCDRLVRCSCPCHDPAQLQRLNPAYCPKAAAKETAETAMKDPLATLIHEWTVDKESYRLVAVANYKAGYEDEYLIEKLGKDGIGEPRWDRLCDWSRKKNGPPPLTDLLVLAIKSLLRDQRSRQ